MIDLHTDGVHLLLTIVRSCVAAEAEGDVPVFAESAEGKVSEAGD